jgi:glycolate oxidase iron-sulfur subunit
MYAAAEGRISLDRIESALALCLGCQACETACPSGIRYHDMLEAERADVAAWTRFRLGRRFGRWLLNAVLISPRRLRVLVWVLWAYQASGAQLLVRASHLLNLLAPPLSRRERRLPPLTRPQRWRNAESTQPGPLPALQGSAVLLTGCVMDAAFGEVHRATLRVLAANAIEAVEVPSQACCGALHIHSGETESARDLARLNIAAFEAAGTQPVLVNSAGCGAMLKGYGLLLQGDPAWALRALAFSARVRDVCEYLAAIPLAEPRQAVPHTVVYDDPCHLAHAQGIRDQPRALLKRIPGLRLLPLREAELCCGSAGSYSIVEPEMSKRVLDRKMEHIAASGAEIVATGNPGCLLQLRLGAREHGLPIRIAHPIELLAESYGWPRASS